MLADRVIEFGDVFLVPVERLGEVLVTLDLVEFREPFAFLRGGLFLDFGFRVIVAFVV